MDLESHKVFFRTKIGSDRKMDLLNKIPIFSDFKDWEIQEKVLVVCLCRFYLNLGNRIRVLGRKKDCTGKVFF